MVAASFSTLSGLYWPTWRFLQIPVGLLLMEQFSRVTGFQAHGPQNRSLSPSSTRTFSLLSWQPTSVVPLWAFKRVNFLLDNRSVVKILLCDTSRAPAIMSPVRYLSLLTARHSSSFIETPVRGKSGPIVDFLSHFQFQRFRPLAPHADSIPTQIPQQLLSDKCHFYLNQGLAPSTRKGYASAERRFLDFCAQDNSLPFLGSALPSSEDVLIRFCCHLADTLHHSSITFQQSDPFTSRRVCLLHWLVATKAQISVSANPSQSS